MQLSLVFSALLATTVQASTLRGFGLPDNKQPVEKMPTVATSINGAPVPADLLPLQNNTIMLDATQDDGMRIVVSQGIRPAHTRVGIHYHPYGGHTCVLSGEITDYSEGSDPVVYKAGTCYLMPADTLMSATNQGDVDVVLQDTFVVPNGEVTTVIVESGYPTFGKPVYS